MCHAGKKKCLCEHVRTASSPASEKAFHDDFVASGTALPQLSWSPGFKAKCIGYINMCLYLPLRQRLDRKKKPKNIYKPDSIEINESLASNLAKARYL